MPTLKAVVHPGMHKTGSSSIQANLVATPPCGWVSPDFGNGNLSGLMSLLFEEDPTRNHGFRARGVEKEEIRELQRRTVSQFKAELKSARDAGKNLVFSAERISISSDQSVARLAEFLRQQKFFPRIVAYVRGPVSYMQSSYQQRLQGNGFSLSKPARLWPNYRQAFENWITCSAKRTSV